MAALRFSILGRVFLLVAFTSLLNPLLAQSLQTREFVEGATAGFDRVYSLDYEGARKAFQVLWQQYPQHPGPPLYLALLLWQEELFRRQDLRLDRFVSPESFVESTAQQ